MVLVINGNSEIGAHVHSDIGYQICVFAFVEIDGSKKSDLFSIFFSSNIWFYGNTSTSNIWFYGNTSTSNIWFYGNTSTSNEQTTFLHQPGESYLKLLMENTEQEIKR